MSKKITYLSIMFSLIIFWAGGRQARAEIKFSNVNVYGIKNGTAKISWDTFSEPTKAFVSYGTSADNLGKKIDYGVYDYNHETTLTGLEKDVTYYYKIIAVTKADEAKELFLQTFSTKDMPDTIAPEFITTRIIQVTKDAAAIFYETDEETRAEIKFGADFNNLNRDAGAGDFKKRHEVLIHDLDTDQKYYFKIIAEDRGQNKTSQIIETRTDRYLDSKTELIIDNIKPVDFDPSMVFAKEVKISWRTNLIARCRVRYGNGSEQYDKELEANDEERLLEHIITITGLEPAATYYYKLDCYDSFYDKSKESKEYTFTTLNPSLTVPKPKLPPAPYQDTDGDTLSDNYEKEIGTSPIKKDTDGDGFNDDVEIKYGYDPTVAGDTKLQKVLYLKPQLTAGKELEKGKELRALIRAEMGTVKVSEKNWKTLTNAYVYGGYPVAAIAKAIKFGGRTVHPTIPFGSWKNTAQYKDYINK